MRVMPLLFGTMEKGTLAVLLLIVFVIGGSHQRPQLAQDVPASTTTTTEATANESVKRSTVNKTLQATEATAVATAVSVRTTVNVTSTYVPGEVFDDFEPSNYYDGPDSELKPERPSPQAGREVFRQSPDYFRRPDDRHAQPPAKPNDARHVIFPPPTPTSAAAEDLQQRHNHFERHRPDGQTADESSHRGPHVPSAQVWLRSKPDKHDSGDIPPPGFGGGAHHGGGAGDFYERLHFAGGQHPVYETERYHRPDMAHAPPKSNHGVGIVTAHHKKKDPWRSMLSVLATILPVGLLLASFPPTVIKVDSTQYPYQFQKNSTTYYPNAVVGRYKTLEKINAGRKINEQNESSGYLDDCLKKKICENIKNKYSPSEMDFLLKNYRLNRTDNDGPMAEIAEAAVSATPESCRTFICGN